MKKSTLLGGIAVLALYTGAAMAAEVASVEFSDPPAPSDAAEIVTTHSKSVATVRYSDGTSKAFPLTIWTPIAKT